LPEAGGRDVVMRDLINIVDEEFNRRTTAHKPFAAVTIEDCARAMLDADDLRNILTDGYLWDECYSEDYPEEKDPPPIPANSAGLTPEMLARLCKTLARDDSFVVMKEELAGIAQRKTIPICRRLSRLSDLNQPLGVHWTLGHDAHRNADGEHYGPHTVYAEVSSGQVDWITTVARGLFWWHNEAEITPVAGSTVKLIRIDFGPGTEGTV
jgi:hypothetical protein